MTDLALLKLMQLSSPTLPVGAFAYSQGLESAIENGFITHVNSLQQWLHDALSLSLQQVDLPILARLYQAWQINDEASVMHWNNHLLAQRETRELRDEDLQLGAALARLLHDLDDSTNKPLKNEKRLCFLTLFTLAANRWEISLEQAANGFIWSWLDNQIAAAIKLVPLGQTDGQRALSQLLPAVPAIVKQGLAIKDDEIGASLPMLAILSAQHETQYSRLFRS